MTIQINDVDCILDISFTRKELKKFNVGFRRFMIKHGHGFELDNFTGSKKPRARKSGQEGGD